MHMQPKQTPPPLARSVSHDVLDWDHVEPADSTHAKDGLGLSPADRSALGLSSPRPHELHAPTLGGAEVALAEALARGGANPKPSFRRKHR